MTSVFPPLDSDYILFFQFSSWYPQFSDLSIRSTIIHPLSQEFRDYLDTDGVFVPEGSEDVIAESTLSDDEGNPENDVDEPPRFAFPDLDEKIRACIAEYGAVFPKLNFSSPRDAAWILPASSPLKCTAPSDVYLLLKSSDFITHDLDTENVFEGCDVPANYELELVLRKWYPIDRSRELRCFVRENMLLGISQRDTNYYEYLNESSTSNTILSSVKRFWESKVKGKCEHVKNYVFDILLTRDLQRAHIVDFNPYAPKTDPLLFAYEDLQELLRSRMAGNERDTEFRVIDSRAHPAATSKAPAHQHNMVPFEALSMSSGRDIEDFADLWKESIKKSMRDDS